MIRLFECFAGYGGASFALEKAGLEYECIGYSEIKRSAIKCYDTNFPGRTNYGDITQIRNIPDFNLMTGGFPCQDVSSSGIRDLSKGRTNLFREVIRIADIKKPEFIILENVYGLLLPFEKTGRRPVDIVKSEFYKIGYDMIFSLMNSKNYGVPQNRPRIVMILKKGNWDFNEFDWPRWKKLKPFDEIADTKYKGEYLVPDIIRQKYIDKGILSSFKQNIINNISPCLTTGGPKGIKWEAIMYNDGIGLRYITCSESWRLQGFNGQIKIEGLSDSAQYDLAGDGWDINLFSLIFKNLYK